MLPNILTFLRICGALSLVFIEPLTIAFFIIYSLSGLSDALDGWIARKYDATSEFGTKLDTVADFTFYSVMLFKILPTLKKILPREIWLVVSAIILIRVLSYSLAAIKYHRFATLHTYLNKLTGISLFFVPYFLKTEYGKLLCFIACSIAAIATLEEFIIHISSKTYDSSKKSLLIALPQKTNGAV